MSLAVCCPCGNPLECEHLELIVTMVCPACDLELTLEFELAHHQRRRAVLTVMEGPHWIGERFLVPVDQPLTVGAALGNWLSLDDAGVSDVHCEVKLTPQGNVVVVDRDSAGGTWIGSQRIRRGRLSDRESFKVGAFRLRLDFERSDGTPAAVDSPAVDIGGRVLPSMAQVGGDATAGMWLVRNRYVVSRWLLTVFAWLTGVYHACHLSLHSGWQWYGSAIAGLVILVVLSEAGRRIALVRPYMCPAALVLLLFLVVLDGLWGLPVAAAGELVLMASLALLSCVRATTGRAIAAMLCGVAATTTIATLAIVRAIEAISQYSGSFDFH
ncbi:MAG: FHA domain-containing protein [Phycisphaerae bacterium]